MLVAGKDVKYDELGRRIDRLKRDDSSSDEDLDALCPSSKRDADFERAPRPVGCPRSAEELKKMKKKVREGADRAVWSRLAARYDRTAAGGDGESLAPHPDLRLCGAAWRFLYKF